VTCRIEPGNELLLKQKSTVVGCYSNSHTSLLQLASGPPSSFQCGTPLRGLLTSGRSPYAQLMCTTGITGRRARGLAIREHDCLLVTNTACRDGDVSCE